MIPGELYSLYKKQLLPYEDSARCRLGCRICSCVLVFDSLWLVCHFSLAFFSSWECEMWERTAAVSLQSFAEVTQWLLLYSEVAYQLQCWAAGKEAPENFNYGYSTCYGSSRPESFEKNMSVIQIVDITLISLAIFQHCFQSKNVSLHRNPKLPSMKSDVLICISVPECFSSLSSSEFAVLGRILKKGWSALCFPVLCKLCLWYANQRSRTFSLCPKLSVTSDEKARVWDK